MERLRSETSKADVLGTDSDIGVNLKATTENLKLESVRTPSKFTVGNIKLKYPRPQVASSSEILCFDKIKSTNGSLLKGTKKVTFSTDVKKDRRIKDIGPYKKVVLSRCSKSVSKWIHPSLQRLIQRNHPFLKKRFVVRRNEATRIRNRTLYYFPIPRVFPFHCGICQRSTRSLDVIKDHHCVKKRAQDYDLANEQRIASMGFRCRAKDAMAVMERVPNPQHFEICMVKFHDVDDIIHPVPIKSLKQICASVIHPLLPSNYHGSVEFRKKSTNGLMCTKCGVTFPLGGSYHSHLKEEDFCKNGTAEPVYIRNPVRSSNNSSAKGTSI